MRLWLKKRINKIKFGDQICKRGLLLKTELPSLATFMKYGHGDKKTKQKQRTKISNNICVCSFLTCVPTTNTKTSFWIDNDCESP